MRRYKTSKPKFGVLKTYYLYLIISFDILDLKKMFLQEE